MFAELPPEDIIDEPISLDDMPDDDMLADDIEESELIGADELISDELLLLDEDVEVLELPLPEPLPHAASRGEAAAPATPAPRMRSSRRRFIAVARSWASKSEPVTIDLRSGVGRPMTHASCHNVARRGRGRQHPPVTSR